MKVHRVLSLAVLVALATITSRAAIAACVQNVRDNLNIRADATSSSATIGVIPKNSCRVAVDTVGCKGNWCRIFYDGKTGWANANFLSAKPEQHTFNYYILRAVYETVAQRTARGYHLSRVYSQDLRYLSPANKLKRFYYAEGKWIYPGVPGHTMCVAAVAEVMVEALNLYVDESKDETVSTSLPMVHFAEKAQTKHLRLHLWEYKDEKIDLKSKGAGHALERFNIGKQKPYRDLTPGDFIKISRSGGSGHSMIFIAFIDAAGKTLERYGNNATGFLYFSAQETAAVGLDGKAVTPGFGFKKEYFSNSCPSDAAKKANMCRVFAEGGPYPPNLGEMYHPVSWGEVGSNYKKELTRSLYQAKTGKPLDEDPVAFTASGEGSWLKGELDSLLNREMDPSFVGDWE